MLSTLVLLPVQSDSRVVLEVTGSTHPKGCIGWRNWLRHCATSRKVAGLVPNGTLEFSVTMGSTYCLTDMSTRNISCVCVCVCVCVCEGGGGGQSESGW